ncbi:MAG: YidC/Oxa1 family membrane protein insertase [Acidimicrobiia bacterium]|nr:YidC/Oxa1 family membrane protein insertase [Acidimicrobiia bacterium]
MFDFLGTLFDGLIALLGSVLAAMFDFFSLVVSAGWAYGLAIIVLTILINIVVFPLTLKQTRATRAFTEIQPKIKKIQAEYKDDPQEMQRRLLETQREAGATPGGCLLPLLVQMPIWFALFRLLQGPIRYLREVGSDGNLTSRLQVDTSGIPIIDTTAVQPINPASKLGEMLHQLGDFLDPGSLELTNWIPGLDMSTFLGMNLGISPSAAVGHFGLASAFPYLLMIGFMVAVQYVQQWHATYGAERPDQPGAGAQQAITKIMPLFIGFISWNFPAGLVLYWATSNLFRLGQQAVIFKIDGRPSSPGTPKESTESKESDSGQAKKPQPGAANKRRRRRRR